VHFLKRRQLKDASTTLLGEIKDRNGLKRGQVTTDKAASYDVIVESLGKSLGEGWLSANELIRLLEDAELAGRQHLCLFEVPEDLLETISHGLLKPRTLNDEPVSLEEFWEVPLEPYCRLIVERAPLLLKIIAVRSYWTKEKQRITDDEYRIHAKRHKERAAVIVKFDADQRTLQFRVPISENAQDTETARAVYEFIESLVANQFGEQGRAWFLKLRHWPVGDAFERIVNNHDDFELHTDTPENNRFKGSLSKKGVADDGVDLRGMEEWNFSSGYARSSLRGKWKTGDLAVDVSMHAARVRVSRQTIRKFARFFFPKPCSDAEVEHVLRRVREHLPPRSGDSEVAAPGFARPEHATG
jgi:hypothetical protein